MQGLVLIRLRVYKVLGSGFMRFRVQATSLDT